MLRSNLLKFIRCVWYLAALAVILVAVFFSIFRLMMPLLNQHHDYFEQVASRELGRPVKIGHIEAIWRGFRPMIKFDDVWIQNSGPASSSTLLQQTQANDGFHVGQLDVGLDLFGSLLHWKILPGIIVLNGAVITVVQHPGDGLSINGFGNVHLPTAGDVSSPQASQIVTWLLSQRHLQLANIVIHYQTLTNTDVAFQVNFLDFKNKDFTHLVAAQVIDLHNPLSALDISLSLSGNAHHLASLKGLLYVKGDFIPLSDLEALVPVNDAPVLSKLKIVQGDLHFQLWGHYEDNVVQSIKTLFSVDQLGLQSLVTPSEMLNFRSLKGRLAWVQSTPGVWVMKGDPITIQNTAGISADFSFFLSKVAGLGPVKKQIWIHELQLHDFNPLVEMLLSEKMRLQWQELKPDAHFQNIIIDDTAVSPTGELVPSVSGAFTGLSVQKFGQSPGVKNLSGDLSWNQSRGSINLHSAPSQLVVIDETPLFSKPFMFDAVNGHIDFWKSVNGAWNVKVNPLILSNQHFSAQAHVALRMDPGQPVMMDLLSSYQLDKASEVNAYLPFGTMDKETKAWLTSAFTSGQLRGVALFRGPLDAHFPYEDHSGTFLIQGDVKGVNLHYADAWPDVTGIYAQVVYDGTAIHINGDTGTIAGLHLNHITARIPLFGKSILEVNAEGQGFSSQGIDFLRASPIGKTMAKGFDLFTITGPLAIKSFTFKMPLSGESSNSEVSGVFDLSKNTVSLPDWNIAMSNVSGAVLLNANGLLTSTLTGSLFNFPAVLKINTNTVEVKAPLSITVDGHISSATWNQRIPKPLNSLLAGEADFKGLAFFPAAITHQDPQLTFTSDLKGLSLDLPAPFGKKNVDAKPLFLKVTFGDKPPLSLFINYDDVFRGVFSWHQEKNNPLFFYGGDLYLGKGTLESHDRPGLYVSGDLGDLAWQDWEPYLKYFNANSSTDPNLLKEIDLNIDQLSAYDQILSPVTLMITPQSGSVSVALNSPTVLGHLSIPSDFPQKTLVANFQRLYLSSPVKSSAETSTLNPKDIPPLQIHADDFHYNDLALGAAMVALSPIPNGVGIYQLKLDSSMLHLDTSGRWTMDSSHESQTRFENGHVSSDDIKKLFSAFGIKSNLILTTGSADFSELQWNDTLFKPSSSTLSGDVRFKMGRGEMVNLDEGTQKKLYAGKLISLLSLDSLENRFSEVSSSGYAFDSVSGSVAIKQGNLTTKDTQFSGTVANIGVVGRIGLSGKNYDLSVVVQSKVTSSLPVIVGVIGGPLALGIAWVANKAVSGLVDKFVTVEYKLTGSWQNPVFVPVK